MKNAGICKKKIVPIKRNIILSMLLFTILAVWTVWGNTALMTNAVAISSSRIPASFSGFRIAQVSDLHNAEFGKNNAELLKLLSESRPDIIVITGDLIDANHTDVWIALGFAQESLERNGETITLLGLGDPDFTVK